MTCIVGLKHDGRVTIGGDSAGIGGNYELDHRADPKVFHLGPQIVVGFTSSFRMGDLLRYRMIDCSQPPKIDNLLHAWMVAEFIEGVRKSLGEGGFRKREHEQEEGGEFLIGVRSKLFLVCSDFQVAESRLDYMATGCAGQIARGSMHTSRYAERLPRQRIIHALEAAEALSAGVRGPFTIEETEP